MKQLRIDINCDLGESYGRYKLGQDEEILKSITSANIACGFHAGDPRVIFETVKMAQKEGVGIGAHPGYPDLNGFGRREMKLTSAEIYQLIIYQLGALQGFARVFGTRIRHVKPHGALYNQAAKDRRIAEAIATAVADLDEELILFGLAGGELVSAGQRLNLKVASEVFADRTYQADGSLTPRDRPDALITDSQAAVFQVLQMIKQKKVTATDGSELSLCADTVCVHGDGQNALEFVQELTLNLRQAGIEILPVGKER